MIETGLIIYMLKTAICLLVFLGISRWFMKRSRSSRLNRLYLLLAPVISSLIPLVQVNVQAGGFWPEVSFSSMPWMGGELLFGGMNKSLPFSPEFIVRTGDVLFAVYGLGVLFLFVAFLKGLLGTLRSVRRLNQENPPFTSLPHDRFLPAMSLFSARYWTGDHQPEVEEDYFRSIAGQIKPYHALEVVLMEVMVIFGWFLPMIWGFRNRLREAHVFESDGYIAGATGNRERLIRALLDAYGKNDSRGHQVQPILSKRIEALQKSAVGRARKPAVYLLVFPALACLLWLCGTGSVPVPFLDKVVSFLGEELESLSGAEVIRLNSGHPDRVFMEWAGKEVPLVHIEDQTEVEFPFNEFTQDEFRKFQTQLPVIYRQDGTLCEIMTVRISITASDHQSFYNLECPGANMKCLHEAMEGMPATSSIQLVFIDGDGQQYYCILTDEEKTLYIPNRWYIEDPFIFDKPPALKSYGVEKMTRISPRYEILWGPDLRFGLDHPEMHPVTPEAMSSALNSLPALTPIHGGVIDKFEFELRYASQGGEELKMSLTVDQLDPDGFLGQPYLQIIRQNLAAGDILFIEKMRLTDGREIGSFACRIVDDPWTFGRRKWNLANFNFSDGNKSRILNQLTEEPDAYILKWGTYFIPLELYASPDLYKGGIEMETAQFGDLLEYPIEVYRNNEKLSSGNVPRSLKLVYHHNTEMSPEPISMIPGEGDIRVRKQDLGRVAQLARPGQRLSLAGDVAGIHLNALEIDLIDPESPYRPSIRIPNQHAGSGEYAFQVIQGIGDQKTVIKIDSASNSAREILEMYRDDRKYEIIQIPGFRTSRRLITPDFKAYGSRAKLLGTQFADVHKLKEYLLQVEDDAMMKWGRMVANPASGNYSAREFRFSGRWPLRLILNSNKMKVLQMEVKLYSGEKLAHHFKVSQLNHPVLQKAIQSIPSRGAVLITNIVVSAHGQSLLFPQDFAFFVE